MKRTRSPKLRMPLLYSLLAITCAPAVNADDDDSGPNAGALRQAEVISGQFTCNIDRGFPSVNLAFFGTGLINTFNLPLPIPDDISVCDDAVVGTAVIAQSLGCTVGSVDTPSETFRRFSFVCDGSRNEMVNVIAQISRFIVAP